MGVPSPRLRAGVTMRLIPSKNASRILSLNLSMRASVRPIPPTVPIVCTAISYPKERSICSSSNLRSMNCTTRAPGMISAKQSKGSFCRHAGTTRISISLPSIFTICPMSSLTAKESLPGRSQPSTAFLCSMGSMRSIRPGR